MCSSSPTRRPRLGFLGGSYDPPHLGHWLAAVDAFEQLALDRLDFVPAGEQPLKGGAGVTPVVHRLAMVRCLAEGDARFGVDARETERTGPSYTVDTLRALAASHPDAERFWLIGSDCVPDLGRWKDADALSSLATLVVMARPGAPAQASPYPLRRVATRPVALSSTEVRARVRAGRSLRGFVPDAVATYIATHRLYQEPAEGQP
jgi:nicotinate-nucleotide adenylyltransferase